MQDRIVARLITPTLISVQLGALTTTLFWLFYGYAIGAPTLALSLFSTWRAIQTGFVLDQRGLLMRPFLPFRGTEVVPWAKIASLDVDKVVLGGDSPVTRLRMRFMTHDAATPVQVIGYRLPTVTKVLAAMRAHGIAVTDSRPLPDGA